MLVSAAGRRDGSSKGPDGGAGGDVVKTLAHEAAACPGESARTARDGRRFHDVQETGRRRRGYSGEFRSERVAIGSHEVIEPGRIRWNHHVRDVHGEQA